ncbi:MAG: DUF2249 domain-containing protein [Streptosporangiaceae bacterium]
MPDRELDVRPLPKPDKHPAIFGAYEALAAGESFILVNNHDPRHLRDEFDADHPRQLRAGLPLQGAGGVADPDQQARVHPAAPDPVRHRHRRGGRRS